MTTTPSQSFDIVIVGSGFAGVAMAAQLKRRGIDDFVLLERADDIGGTWRDNTYPGAACDVPSPLYSFSFRLNPDWSRLFAPGHEILRYLKDVAEEEGIMPHVRLSTLVEEAAWNDMTGRWTVRTAKGVFDARVLVFGMGHLADEAMPTIPGLESFTGDVFHSARWRHDIDVSGKRIGIVGSGASAIQVVPEVAKSAAEVVIFQRSAPYIMPRLDRAFSEADRRTFRRNPELMREMRENIFWYLESTFASRRGIQSYLKENKRLALAHLNAQVQDDALRAVLTPDYEMGCKRVLLSNDYYPTMTQENVVVEPSALAGVDGATAKGASGAAYDVDALIFCTGFEAARPPFAKIVRGRHGQTLEEAWADGMEAFASTTAHGFPNFFMLNGPNTGLGHNSIVYIIESQVEYVLEALDWMEREGVATLEPDAAAQAGYVDGLQDQARGTVWLSNGCKSWYLDPGSRKLTLVWPDFAHAFRHRNGSFSPSGYVAESCAEPQVPKPVLADT